MRMWRDAYVVSMGRGGPWPLKYSVTGSWNVADGGARAGGRRTEDQGDVWEELCGTPWCIPALRMPPRRGDYFHRKASTEDTGKGRNHWPETRNAIMGKGQGKTS